MRHEIPPIIKPLVRVDDAAFIRANVMKVINLTPNPRYL